MLASRSAAINPEVVAAYPGLIRVPSLATQQFLGRNGRGRASRRRWARKHKQRQEGNKHDKKPKPHGRLTGPVPVEPLARSGDYANGLVHVLPVVRRKHRPV
jgi:hypothetical protein